MTGASPQSSVWARSLPRERRTRLALLIATLVLSQFLLFGPSLLGRKILLPLDLLAYPGFYLPQTPEYADVKPGHQVFTDLLFEYEMGRRFVVSELRAGRIPLWNPHGYTGTPFANFFKYSPFMWPYYVFGAPWTLAWIQLLVALVAGSGAYVFFRRVLQLGAWPSGVAACCYPLTGFYMLWEGFSLPYVTAWFPWMLVATERAIRDPSRWGGPALALLTAAALVSGQVDVAGQSLLAAGIFAIWCWLKEYSPRFRVSSSPAQSTQEHSGSPTEASSPARAIPQRRATIAVVSILAAWSLGFLIASPYLLPLSDYVKTGSRFAERTRGAEERPPIGLSALPQMVVPNIYGTARENSAYLAPGNQVEGPGAAYVGLVLTLIVAPLAFRSRRHRSIVWMLCGLALLGLSWDLGLPGFVQLLRLPGLNFMSHNRFVFVSALCLLALAGIGLETLRTASPLSKKWIVGLAIIPIVLGSWCVYRGLNLPEPLATGLEEALKNGKPMYRAVDLPAVRAMQASFSFEYLRGALLCLIALGGLAVLATPLAARRGFQIALALVFWGELFSTAYGFHPQRDPRLYFPSIPVLDKLAESDRDRIVGVGCLPPNLHERFGFRDVRGYDGVDPARIVELLELARDPRVPGTKYAKLLSLSPKGGFTPEGQATLPPVMSMLNVRYMIFRGTPLPNVQTYLQGDDYWICENVSALPRPFVPKRVEQVRPDEVLQKLASPTYDPAEVAYVETSVMLEGTALVPVTDETRGVLTDETGGALTDGARDALTDETREGLTDGARDALTGETREAPTDGARDALAGDARGHAEIRSEEPMRIEIAYSMETPGLIVLADRWDSGWVARVNGVKTQILRTNHAVRGVVVPAGEGTLLFEYRPRGFTIGLWLLGASVLLLVGWSVLLRRTPAIRWG